MVRLDYLFPISELSFRCCIVQLQNSSMGAWLDRLVIIHNARFNNQLTRIT